jgi:hypothetical protein
MTLVGATDSLKEQICASRGGLHLALNESDALHAVRVLPADLPDGSILYSAVWTVRDYETGLPGFGGDDAAPASR